MYHYFNGVLAELSGTYAVIDCGGVGYKLGISVNTYKELLKEKEKGSEKVKLYSYLSVREDAHDLFGFYNPEEKNAYLLLISVSGVGPKAALAILSEMTFNSFAVAVVTGDTKAFTKASGVGPKLASRIVLELKDKIKNEQIISDGFDEKDAYIPSGSPKAEAVNALSVLGYSRNEANSAVNRCALFEGATVEDYIREALKQLLPKSF